MSDDPTTGQRSDRRSLLGRLDDALVPRLQRGARGVRRGLGWPGRALRRFDRGFLGGRPARTVDDHRGLAALLVVLLAFAGTLVHVERYPDLRDRADADGAAATADDGEVTAVGPVVGASVEPYLRERREALATAPTGQDRVAVVSFVDFRDAEAVAAAVDGLRVHAVAHQLPERDARPQWLEVEDDLADTMATWLADRVAEIEQEEDDVASTLETTDDPEFREDFQARLDELTALRNTLRGDPQVVFAVTVTGSVARLQQLAADEGVRLVDLAPPGTDPSTTAFHGVLPTADQRFAHGRDVP